MKNKISTILTVVSLAIFFSLSFCWAQNFKEVYVGMQGEGEVGAPQFYLGSAGEENLLINQKVDYCASFGISGEYRTFDTPELNKVNFNYAPQANMFVRAKVATSTPQDLVVRFGYYRDGAVHYLCSQNVTVNSELGNYVAACSYNSEKPQAVDKFFYEFKKGCPDCDYTISKCAGGFYTKVSIYE